MTDSEFAVIQAVRAAVSQDPEFMRVVVDAAIAGQRDHIKKINERRSELERAWVTALLVMQDDRITPGLKKTLLHSLLPVLERYGLEGECKAVTDAHAMASAA